MHKLGFSIVTAITLALMLCVLELNRNTLLGFALTLALAALYVFISIKLPGSPRWFARVGLWAAWAAVFAGILFLTWPPVRSVPAVSAKAPERTGVVSLPCGSVRGVKTEDGIVEVFAGIPYAAPPVGELRWREPRDPEPWEGVLEADHFAPMSAQPTNLPIYDSLRQIIGYHDYEIRLDDNCIPPVSEDSLYLNVWRPAGGGEKLPVLVYVHGGSLQTGQPWYGDYSGEGLARQGIIVVNMGYRLGAFGFAAFEEAAAESANGTTGNYGLLDQIKALEWVRDNIAALGGDPGNVTLSGESAGSACVSALCTSPLASGLFRRAVMESSTVVSAEPPHSFRGYEQATEDGRALMERHGCADLAALRALPEKELYGEAYTQHHITVDGYALETYPHEAYAAGRFNEEASLHGTNSEESAPFILFANANMKNFEKKVRDHFKEYADEVLALYPVSTDAEAKAAWAEIWGAIFFDHPHYRLSLLEGENGVPSYQYFFSKGNGRLGPWHSGEEIYLYGNIPEDSRLFDGRDRELSMQMTGYFVNFIKTGDPNGSAPDGSALPEWRAEAPARVMGFGETTGMTDETRLGLFKILDEMAGAY
ncbi:MAG: carboxylesterase family protein [Clostridia bacterium]|nr:carboxylesterase family protein [Clostridia bacterium]